MTENDLLTPYATTNQHGVKIQDISIGSIFKIDKVGLSVSEIQLENKDYVIYFIVETMHVPDGGVCETTVVKVKFEDVKPYIADYDILRLNGYNWYELNGNINVMKCKVGIYSSKTISGLYLHKLQNIHKVFSDEPLKLK